MLKIRDLPEKWDSGPGQKKTAHRYEVQLVLRDAARIAALTEIYPNVSVEQAISDLLTAALNQLEVELPYEPGPTAVETDEFGEPIYEDVGALPRFQEATKRYLKELQDGD